MMRMLFAMLLLLPDGLTHGEFLKLHKELQPYKGEIWQTVPWKISLLEGRTIALREKKPIFIWSMDGNPLACG